MKLCHHQRLQRRRNTTSLHPPFHSTFHAIRSTLQSRQPTIHSAVGWGLDRDSPVSLDTSPECSSYTVNIVPHSPALDTWSTITTTTTTSQQRDWTPSQRRQRHSNGTELHHNDDNKVTAMGTDNWSTTTTTPQRREWTASHPTGADQSRPRVESPVAAARRLTHAYNNAAHSSGVLKKIRHRVLPASSHSAFPVTHTRGESG